MCIGQSSVFTEAATDRSCVSLQAQFVGFITAYYIGQFIQVIYRR